MPLVNEQAKKIGVICTYSGNLVDLTAPKAADIQLVDIAHALSQCNRWHGATRRPYSVAAHCLAVAGWVKGACEGREFGASYTRQLTLAALLHDATEAYVIDLPAPIKRLPGFEAYAALEADMARVVAEHFGLDPQLFHHPLVAHADKLAAVCEAHLLVPGAAKWAGERPDGLTMWQMVRKAESPRKLRTAYIQAVEGLTR